MCEVKGALQRPGCVVYSLGSHMETTFEEDILAYTQCEVHTFDHSLSQTDQTAIAAISPRLSFHPYYIGMGHTRTPHYTEKSIRNIMKELNHKWIDVLKMDIEESEWDVLEALIESDSLHFTQLQVEFHLTTVSLQRVINILTGLTKAGYRVFSVEPNLYCCSGNLVEYSFIRMSENGQAMIGSIA